MGPEELFHYYLEHFFKFPKEIKNDIVYCQRALRTHIKVHQMVLSVFHQQDDADTNLKKKIIKDLEKDIYEINAEQQFLFLRLRRNTDEFFKRLKKNGIPVDVNAVNDIISGEVVPLVMDENIEIRPNSVLKRPTEEQLIQRYFEEEQMRLRDAHDNSDDDEEEEEEGDNEIYEVLDSDEERELKAQSIKAAKAVKAKFSNNNNNNNNNNDKNCETIVVEADPPVVILPNGKIHSHKNSTENIQGQVSLLKPISERVVIKPNRALSIGAASAGNYMDGLRKQQQKPQHQQLMKTASVTVTSAQNEASTVLLAEGKDLETAAGSSLDLPPSKNVTMSRLNLRQALKKARTETMAAKAAAAARVPPPPLQSIGGRATHAAPTSNTTGSAVTRSAQAAAVASQTAQKALSTAVGNKKSESKIKAGRAAAASGVSAASSGPAKGEINSSSEDSNPDVAVPMWPTEPEDTRTKPEHYGQEMFLRIFSLFTPDVLTQMQQRRSKRKRRCVQNNERNDFHYGRIEQSMAAAEEAKKKRKTFLLSPNVKRGRKRNGPDAIEASNSAPSSRSASSSPDDKRVCHECLKGGGAFDQCSECKNFYHQECHREGFAVDGMQLKEREDFDKANLCPACKRLQAQIVEKEAQQYQSLHSTVHELEMKLAVEKERRASLQQSSKMYKLQMRNLFNIVNTIKEDAYEEEGENNVMD